MARRDRSVPPRRSGNILILTALLMIFMMAVLAFAVDLGYLLMARTELQRAADSAALAAAWELVDQGEFADDPDLSSAIASARSQATAYAALNPVTRDAPTVDFNSGNDVEGDVVLGYLSDLSNQNATFAYNDPALYNAVTVRVRRNGIQNSMVPMFFARIFGVNNSSLEAEATAALLKGISGFQTPSDGSNLGILPFALDEESWNELLAGNADDDWAWDEVSGEVKPWSDGIRELNLYPQGTGSPGNRGTVDIGSNNNSTNDIARQITDGVSPSDLDHHGGELKLDDNGDLFLNGDTGISAGVKDELASILGEPRTIPIFRSVSGPGNNATYTIVKFAGIRIMEVNLTGSENSKRVIIQPAPMVSKGAIPATSSGTSYLIFSPVHLVR